MRAIPLPIKPMLYIYSPLQWPVWVPNCSISMFVSKETLFDLLIASEHKNSNTCNFIKAWYYSIINVVNFLLCFIWKLNFIMGIYVAQIIVYLGVSTVWGARYPEGYWNISSMKMWLILINNVCVTGRYFPQYCVY